MRSHLGGVNGDSGVLGSNADAHDEASSEETLPCSGEAGTDGSGSQAERSEEDLTATAKVVVEGIDNECAAAGGQCVLEVAM